MSSLIIT